MASGTREEFARGGPFPTVPFYGRPMSKSVGRMSADRSMRRCSVTLALGALLLGALGVAAGSVWVLGAGAWLLIAAVLLELVYRP